MMSDRRYKQQRLMTVRMEDLVPQDHLLRKLDEAVELDFIYELVRPLYSSKGRPSIDPVTLIKMLLVGYLYGIDSERRLEKEIQVNLAYRWYIGLDLEDVVPDHSTLSQNRRRRYKGTTIFEDIFLQVVRLCIDAGLVRGEAIGMDSTHVRASADNGKAETVTVVTEPREYLDKLETEIEEKEAASHGGKKKRGRKPQKQTAFHITEEVKSTTDPDSGMLGRPGKPKGFHYLMHQSADIEYGIITDVHVTAGNRLDHECCVERIKAQKENLNLPIKQFVADKGYDMMEIHHMLGEMGIEVYTPVKAPHEGTPRHEITSGQFAYDKGKDIYYCPGGHELHFSCYTREHDNIFKEYHSSAPVCRDCPLRAKCFAPTRKVRKIKRSYSTEYMEASRALVGTKRYNYLQRRRRIVCEGNFANMKDNGNLRRTRKRGQENAMEHCLLCAIALNLKKLLKYGGHIPTHKEELRWFSSFGVLLYAYLSTRPKTLQLRTKQGK